jgi:hypothetical protein
MAKQRRADDHAARLKEAFSGWTSYRVESLMKARKNILA